MQEFPNIIEDLEDWPITRFYNDRQRIVKKLAEETKKYIFQHNDRAKVLSMLNQTIYSEKLRVKTDPLKVDPPNENVYWKKLESEVNEEIIKQDGDDTFIEDKVSKILNRYAEEIAGDFNPKTFLFARKALTKLFGAIYNPFYNKKGGALWGSKESLLDKFDIQGPTDHIRDLFDKGTVLILPTHFSNLDSILIGYAIEMLTGLPAFSYGAGLNLYDYEIMAYYMSRLGAYKLDRRKKNPIYAQAIRQFSTISIQEGLNSIFFPGGTRSRNGAIEDKIKLGLLSTLIDSQNEFYLRNYSKKIIIVPLVISYHFVLEGSSLIDQYLKKTYKENYYSKKKVKKTSMRSLRFVSRLFRSNSSVTLSFGDPIDVFGNYIDKEARSIKNGKEVNIEKYFTSNEKVTYDKQRNLVYTRHLGNEITKSFSKENVVLTSHLVTFVVFQMFKKTYANIDLFNLVNLPEEYLDIELDRVGAQIDKIKALLLTLEKENRIKISPEIKSLNAQEIIDHALKNMNVYHFYKPLKKKSGRLISENFKLLYYYSNRMAGYNLDDYINVNKAKSFTLAETLY